MRVPSTAGRFLFIAVAVLLLAVMVTCTFSGISDSASDNVTDNITDNATDTGTDNITDNQTAIIESHPTPEESMPRISIAELKQKIDSGQNILIVDTRHREEYDVDHIKGAISAPLDDIISGKWQPPADKELILYCG